MGTKEAPTRKAVSIFSGAGGLDLGLEAAGWNIVAQVEMDEDCAGTLKRQAIHQGRPPNVIQSRIEDVDLSELKRVLALGGERLDLLAGGPPCQPFTTTGLRQGINDGRASTTLPRYIEFVSELMPRAILVENVDGMLSAALRHRPLSGRGPGNPPLAWEETKGSFLHWLLEQLGALGYTVTWGVVEAADYGVPQMRQRSVLIGVLGSEPCFLPSPTHGGIGQPRYRTLRDALDGLESLGPIQPLSRRKCEVFNQIPPGGNWRDLPVETRRSTMGAAFAAEGGKSGWWRRLAWDQPAPTILGMPDHSSTGLIHPDEVRCLSVAECAAIQTFPRWVQFAGRPRSQYQQIGNAVPSRLGECLGRQVLQFLDGRRFDVPPAPIWKKSSANRRIGTHGWATRNGTGMRWRLLTKVREDHVWSNGTQSLDLR